MLRVVHRAFAAALSRVRLTQQKPDCRMITFSFCDAMIAWKDRCLRSR
jgi:hypothetical protein